ncbi:putative ADP-ribosylation factor GTPase-activating protein AGD14 [Phytophthora citrophthora]|uniref:ADP-ribosylation factor GTPase-activating protein AGD14 n=1 Tax=Phytophthora citrophthora TaxID=4793 RepID=A0AAD9G1M5_9STRA|nr:putative ADP-ribosylation factor GTPase-activating protein AGD14 [Phytophthora citrophthora]
MAAEAEAALNALKKLEANKTCVNCGNYNRFGHQNICEKVRTFVCSNCKSAHQSYSMRVKSVSMSNWTMDEVDALREQNGGGNAVAGRVWLGRWDESQMRKPTKDDPLDYYKQFINRVYNDKAFYDEDGFSAAPSSNSNSSGRSAPPSSSSAAAPVSNLLDFDAPAQKKVSNGSFDAFGTSSNGSSNDGWGNFAAAPAPVSSNDGFGAFASAPAPTNNGFADFSAAPSPAPAANDGFGAFTAAPPAPTSNSFDPFAVSPNAPASNGAAPFDPFAPAPSSQSQNPSANIMNQFNVAPAPKDFSVFDGLSTPSLAYGAPQRNNNGYGQARGPNGMGMQHHGQQMHMGMGMHQGMGMQQQYGGFQQQQQHFQQQPMMGGNSGMNISSAFAPNHGNPGARSNGRDPFAGLGLPQK